MNRPLSELKFRVSIISKFPDDLKKDCIEIAKEKKPSSAFDLAFRLAVSKGWNEISGRGIAKATRWLAVIRREHGEEIFQQVVKGL